MRIPKSWKSSKSLFIGQVIKLPNTQRTYHTVRSGDYLGKIARQYGTSINKIKRFNRIRKNKIYVGQKLLVKAN